MRDLSNAKPPRWAETFLSFYCRPELLEDLQGDLNEYFQRNLKSKGARRARLIYIIDVFKFFRTYTVRKPEFLNLFIQWIMIGSYIKTSSRSIVRNKLFSAINIIGLAISMSVGLLMISLLSDVLSYDTFNKQHKNIYRVVSSYQFLDNKDENRMATTSLRASKIIQETFPISAMAVFESGFGGDMKAGEKTIPLQGFWANESLFKVFDFVLLSGNENTSLKEPYSMVITETGARKLFGDEDPMGKIIVNNEKQFTVTGVLQDLPYFSHIKFEALGSLSTYELLSKGEKDFNSWSNIWNAWVYVVIPPESNIELFKTNLAAMCVREDRTVKNTHIALDLQPLDEIVTGESMNNKIGPYLGRVGLWTFGGLSFIVILSACFNYTNLSIARSLKRTREVGIRKVIGALKIHVIGQFVVEAIIIALGALALAFLLFLMIRPYFLSIEPSFNQLLSLQLTPQIVIYFVAFALLVGTFSGVFPAVFFSRVNAIRVLKDVSASGLMRKLTLRRFLIVFQYTLSIMFITSTVLMYKQYKYFLEYDLGFKTENILNIKLQGNKPEGLRKELSELPEVTGISQSKLITSVGNYWVTQVKYHGSPNDSTGVFYNIVDENYLALHDFKLKSGRNFNPKSDSAKETEVIVNEHLLKRFNISEDKALDDFITLDGHDVRIIGVMKNFQYGKASDENPKDVVLRYASNGANHLNVKLHTSDILATHQKIEAIWKKYDNAHPLEAKFYDEQLQDAFSGLSASIKVGGFLAFLAICIASLGLLGMVVFTTETRLKEISIRKVMGATEGGLLYLLSKGFVALLVVATAVALPLTVLAFEKILFPTWSTHAPLTVVDLAVGVVAIFFIALIMIASQTLKVARTNPAEVLKSE